MGGQVMRPLMHWPRWHYYHLLHSPSLLSTTTTTTNPNPHRPFLTLFASQQSRGLRLPNAQSPPSDYIDTESDDGDSKMSRNQMKRNARRAVRWGIYLASFSPPQIKRILRVMSLDREVFDALMLVKRLGRDVKEGKRRQFNYIGRLLREVEPELMEGLIQATKDGDMSKLQGLAGSEIWVSDDDDEEEEETEDEDEEEGYHNDVDIATRWMDGLVKKDSEITKEVYSVHSVEFDRQELRRLVRKVHGIEERQVTSEENEGEVDVALTGAKRSLTRFLQGVAKQLPAE